MAYAQELKCFVDKTGRLRDPLKRDGQIYVDLCCMLFLCLYSVSFVF